MTMWQLMAVIPEAIDHTCRSWTETTPRMPPRSFSIWEIFRCLGVPSSRISTLSATSSHELYSTRQPTIAETMGSARRHCRDHDQDAGKNRPDGTERVAENVKKRSAQIQIFLPAPEQQSGRDKVRAKPRHRNDQHGQALHFGRRPETLIRFVENVKAQQDQKNPVGERRQYLSPQVAIGFFMRRGARGNLQGEKTQAESPRSYRPEQCAAPQFFRP